MRGKERKMLENIEILSDEKVEELAATTRRMYRWCLIEFADWLAGRNLDPEDVEKTHILEWLNSREWSQSSKHNALCAIRMYYRRHCENTVPEGISIKRPRPKPQRTLYEEEVVQLLASIDTSRDKGIRDLSILTLMIDTGMRANELCSLHAENIDHERRTVDLKIKGGDWHRSVFGKCCAEWLRSWLATRIDHAGLGVPFLYVGIGGNTPGQKMTVTGLRANFYKLATLANIPRFSPHALRRTFATLATRFGEPKRTIQANGGWQSAEMVDLYTMNIRPEDFKNFPTDHIMGLTDA